MAGFDLKAHITGHAHTTSDGLPENFNLQSPQNTHFTFSFDKSQFILNHNTTNQKEIDKIMTDFFNDLQKEQYYFQESNGKGKAPRTRMLDLNNTLMAYHNQSSEAMNNYSVYDHIHILVPGQLKNSKGESTKLGKGYSHLRNLISDVAARHNLVANFEEATSYEKDKNSKASATGFTWYMKKASDQAFINAVNNGNLLKALNKIETAYKKGDTTQDHLFKGYLGLQYRLNKLDIDLIDKQGKKLRYDFPILLNKDHKKEISILKSGDREKITGLIQDRNSKITRACIEQAFGFNSVVYDVLQNKGQLLQGIDLDLIKEIANDPNVKVDIQKKDKDYKSQRWQKSLGYHVKQDIETVLKYSVNEKSFRENLQELGYQDLKIKSKDKQKIGISFTNPHNGKTATVYFNQLRMSIPQITKQLMENKQLLDAGTLPEKPKLSYKDSFLSKYIPKEQDQEYLKRKRKIQDIEFERIYGRTPQTDLTGYYITEDKILKKNTFIQVEDNKITVKHQNINELENNVKVIIETAIAKGWDLSKLKVNGSYEFRLAIESEVQRRQQNKLVEVKELAQDTKVDIKVKDIDILKQLKAMNLHNYTHREKPKEYGQVWDIMQRAVLSKDIELLNASYDTLPHEGIEELRLKVLNYGKVLNISSKDIILEIGLDMGLKEHEINHFINEIKLSANYDEKFLNKFVEKLEEKLNDHYLINQDLPDDKLEAALNVMQRLNSEFTRFKKMYIDKKEYIRKVERVDEYLETGRFYSAKKIINELDDTDKIIQNMKYENSIDMVNVLYDFEELKERIDEQSQLDQDTYYSEQNQLSEPDQEVQQIYTNKLQNHKHNQRSYQTQ